MSKHKTSLDLRCGVAQFGRMSLGDRIRAAREAKGLSQGALGKAVGATQTAVSWWERDEREPTRDMVAKIAAELKVPVAALELPSRAEPGRTVPLVGYVGAGSAAHYYASADEGLGEVEAPEDSTPKTVAAEIRGQSLGPALDGWLVYYDEIRSPVTEDLHGRLCVVGLTDGRVLVKVLRPAGMPNHFHLISNGGEEPIFDREVEWAAKVKTMKPRG